MKMINKLMKSIVMIFLILVYSLFGTINLFAGDAGESTSQGGAQDNGYDGDSSSDRGGGDGHDFDGVDFSKSDAEKAEAAAKGAANSESESARSSFGNFWGNFIDAITPGSIASGVAFGVSLGSIITGKPTLATEAHNAIVAEGVNTNVNSAKTQATSPLVSKDKDSNKCPPTCTG